MRVLVLVDLDNCLAETDRGTIRSAQDLVQVCLRPPADPLVPNVQEAVVVLAFNTSTARGVPAALGADNLADLAASFGLVVAGTTAVLEQEFSLSLTMPEAADVALTVLANYSPTDRNAGQFDSVVLFSKDRGMRITLGASLDGTFRGLGVGMMLRAGVSWICEAGCRRHPPTAPNPYTCGAVQPDPCTGFIDRPPRARWAWDRVPDVHALGLLDLARKVEADPALLTQVGLTFSDESSCTRGVDRLTRHLATGVTPTLGPCSHSDGLEVTLSEPPDVNWYFYARSPLGPGALRLKSGEGRYTRYLTARTRVPAWVFGKSARVPMSYRTPRIVEDRLALAWHFPEATPDRVTCSFVRTGRDARRSDFCELDRDDVMRPLTTWWWIATGSGSAKSKLNLPEIELVRTIRGVPCEACRLPSGDLGYRSTGGTGGEVDCPEGLTAGTIGLGVFQRQDLAVVAFFDVTPGRSVTVRPIQDVSWDEIREEMGTLEESQWNVLRLLPLLVAEDEIDKQQSVN